MDTPAAAPAAAPAPAPATPQRERGPAEELIFKRLKPLNKKIQRFRNYVQQPPENLNADQRAAVASLPALEAVAKELDEVMRAMEEVELVAAAKAREVREAAAREAESRVAAQLKDHALEVVGHVTRFMHLHSLLHPARPSDHANLTFAPLILPMRLQDQVLATDILRVGRMYDDLCAGGDAAHAVLTVLFAGPTGQDEEDDRVHHLLNLLSAPDVEAAEGSETDTNHLEVGSTAAEPALSFRDDTSSIAPTDGDDDADFDPQRTPVMSRATTLSDGPLLGNLARGASLNFLQEDELALPEPQVAINVSVVQEYEVVEPASAVMSEAAESVSTPRTPVDWAADEPETEEEAEAQAEQEVEAEAEQQAGTPNGADEVAEVTEGVEAVSVSDGPKPKKERSDRGDKRQGQGDGQQRKRRPQRSAKDKEGGSGSGAEKKERADRAQGPGGKGRPAIPTPTVDEDGFEVKTSRRMSSSGRGRGAPRGRGRGGAPRDGRPAAKDKDASASSTPRKPNANGGGAGTNANANGGKREPKENGTPKPKPSIYKTTQPSAPTSAPIF